MTTIREALRSLRPTAEYLINGEEYSGLSWRDKVQTKPTEQEVNDEIARLALIPADEKRIDEAFPSTDVARVIFEAFFEIANRLQALERKSPITRAQLRDWLKSKLP